MATNDAIAVATETLRQALERACPVQRFPGAQFLTYRSDDFRTQPRIEAGVTLCLYRVRQSKTASSQLLRERDASTPVGLPLHLHFVVTAWGRVVTEEHALLGWLAFTLHSSPVLGTEELRAAAKALSGCDPETFSANEVLRLDSLDFDETERVALQQAGVSLESRSLLVSVFVQLNGARAIP